MTDYKFIYFQEHARRGLKKLSVQVTNWLEKESSIEIVSTNLSTVGDYIVYTAIYRDSVETSAREMSPEPRSSHYSRATALAGFSTPDEMEELVEEVGEEADSESSTPQRLSINSLFGKNG